MCPAGCRRIPQSEVSGPEFTGVGYRIEPLLPTMRVSNGEKETLAEERPRVAILMGSRNDWEIMQAAQKALDQLGVASEARVISAHRTPERLTRFVAGAEESGIEVLICGAGHAAHLAGVTAAVCVPLLLGRRRLRAW